MTNSNYVMSRTSKNQESSSWYLLWSNFERNNLDLSGSHQEKIIGVPQRHFRKRFVTRYYYIVILLGRWWWVILHWIPQTPNSSVSGSIITILYAPSISELYLYVSHRWEVRNNIPTYGKFGFLHWKTGGACRKIKHVPNWFKTSGKQVN